MAFRRRAYADSKTATGDTSRVGKWAALVTLAVLIVGLILAVGQIDQLRKTLGSGDLRVESTSESLTQNGDGTCTWVIEIELENTAGLRLQLDSVQSAMGGLLPVPGRFSPRESGFTENVLNPSITTTAKATFQLDACPDSTADLKRDPISVSYSSRNYTGRIRVVG